MNKKKIEQIIREEFEQIIPKKSPPVSLKEYVQSQVKEEVTATPPPLLRVLVMATLAIIVLVLIPMMTFIPGLITTTTQSGPPTTPSTTTTSSSNSSTTSITNSSGTTTTSTGTTTTTTTTTTGTTTTMTTTTTTTSTTTTTITTTTGVVVLDIDEVSTQVVTAAKLVIQMSASEVLQLANHLNEPILLLDEEIQMMNQYVFALEQFIASPDGLQTLVQVSDRENYDFKIRIQSALLTGEIQTMWMYYNVIQDSNPITIQGIIVMDNLETSFEGQMEDEGDEQKWTIHSYPDLDDLTTYIKIMQKVEGDERKYQTLHVKNGITLSQNEMKFEKSGQEMKIVVRIASLDKIFDFNIKRELDEGDYIIKGDYEIQFGDSHEAGSFQIDIEENPLNQNSDYVYTVKSEQVEKTYRKERIHKTTFEGPTEQQKTTL